MLSSPKWGAKPCVFWILFPVPNYHLLHALPPKTNLTLSFLPNFDYFHLS